MYYRLTTGLSILLFLSQISFAQNRLSGHAGLNYSSVSSKNSINPDGILGMNAGFDYKFHLGDLGWAVTPGIDYSQEGFNGQRLNYLNVPISLGFNFTNSFSLSAGFQFSQLLGGSNEAKQIIFPTNYAFLVTFEFFPSERFVTGLRFANGVKNIIKNPDVIVVQNATTYSIQFYIGVTLFRGSK
ncbi:MAG: PorT family protein [Cyclobacteriaceae bacterium]|nr:PorT family protein [Cyclobacteriaceae bacterium]